MNDDADWWTSGTVERLEASQRHGEAYCANREKEVRECLKDLAEFCAAGRKIQKENDQALQKLHGDLGKIVSAANQRELTALLTASPHTSIGQQDAPRQKRKGSPKADSVAPLAADDMSVLHGAVEHTRERGQRFNLARIEAWLDEIKKAVQLGNYELVRRALAGLAADVGDT